MTKVKISGIYFNIKLGSGKPALSSYYKPKNAKRKYPIKLVTSNAKEN